jgi:hypothetical protein
VAVTVKLAGCPLVTVTSTGCWLITGGTMTVSKALLVTLPATLVATME